VQSTTNESERKSGMQSIYGYIEKTKILRNYTFRQSDNKINRIFVEFSLK